MATWTDRIRLIFDVDGAPGETAFRRISKSINEVDGGFAKMKAGGKALFGELNKMGSAFALAGGAALINFAIQGAAKFQALAKEAINLGKATGLSTEQASRWIAVADDLGVEAESLTTTFGKIAKTIDGEAWAKYGISTRDANGVIRDTNEILLDALDLLGKTTNGAERARIGNELFGKSFSALAPLIGQTRQEYEAMLAAVPEGEVITPEEAAKAEELRLAMDALGDAVNNISLAFGQVVAAGAPLIDVLTKAVDITTWGVRNIGEQSGEMAGVLTEFSQAAKKSGGSVAELARDWNSFYVGVFNASAIGDKLANMNDEFWNTEKAFNELLGSNKEVAGQTLEMFELWVSGAERGVSGMQDLADQYGLNRDNLNQLRQSYVDAGGASEAYRRAQEEQAKASEEAAQAAWAQYDAVSALANSQLGLRGAVRNLQDAQDELATAEDDSTTSKDEYAEAQDRVLESMLRVAQAASDQAKKQAELEGSTYSARDAADEQIKALEFLRDTLGPTDPLRAQLQAYIDQLNTVPREIRTNAVIGFGTAEFNNLAAMYGQRIPRAFGGPVSAGNAYRVNEFGPEVYTDANGRTYMLPGSNGTVTPVAGGGMVGGAGTTVNVTVNVPPTANPVETGRYVADALRAFYRNGGEPV